MRNCFLVLTILCCLLACDSDISPGDCRVVEAFAGYPESFDNPRENIEYFYRFEFVYDAGELIRVDQYRIDEDNPFTTITDFDIADWEVLDNLEDGRQYAWEDDEVRQFVVMSNGNAIQEGLESVEDPENVFLTGRNYYDAQPNVLRNPAYRAVGVGRGGLAAYNSENNLIAWADLQGSGLFLEYYFGFDRDGLLAQSQIPSGYTLDFHYECP